MANIIKNGKYSSPDFNVVRMGAKDVLLLSNIGAEINYQQQDGWNNGNFDSPIG